MRNAVWFAFAFGLLPVLPATAQSAPETFTAAATLKMANDESAQRTFELASRAAKSTAAILILGGRRILSGGTGGPDVRRLGHR